MTGDVHIGTSGWSYPRGEGTWNGYFYPPGTRNELGFYSEFFDCVEVNSSFYTPLNPAYAEAWARKTPDNFRFTVKLWQKFTHPRMYEKSTGQACVINNDDVELFTSGIRPLHRAGKLGAVLAQFPPGFVNDSGGQQVLGAVLNTFAEYPMAVELRHKSWSDDPDTASLLAKAGAAWVSIDEPRFDTSIASELPLTSDSMAYFRFHGRNAENWWTGNNETRYRYLYSEAEIRGLAEKVGSAVATGRTVYAFFNNHWQAYAPRNARDLVLALQPGLI